MSRVHSSHYRNFHRTWHLLYWIENRAQCFCMPTIHKDPCEFRVDPVRHPKCRGGKEEARYNFVGTKKLQSPNMLSVICHRHYARPHCPSKYLVAVPSKNWMPRTLLLHHRLVAIESDRPTFHSIARFCLTWTSWCMASTKQGFISWGTNHWNRLGHRDRTLESNSTRSCTSRDC